MSNKHQKRAVICDFDVHQSPKRKQTISRDNNVMYSVAAMNIQQSPAVFVTNK